MLILKLMAITNQMKLNHFLQMSTLRSLSVHSIARKIVRSIVKQNIVKVIFCFFLVFTNSALFAKAIDTETKTVTFALTAEPPDLNSLRSTDQISFFVIEHIMDGLLVYDEHDALIPAIAKSWKLDEKSVTFYLRDNALWSDGKQVTAYDFVFAWQTVVKPETASRYAFILTPIKNAEQIIAGKMAAKNLGVEAMDELTLKVHFERPCPYFLSLTTFPTYFPVREDFYKKQGEQYFSDTKNMIFNGPYLLSKWVHGASMRLEKNPYYWNKGNIKINAIDIPYISADPNVHFNLFRNNEIVLAGLDTDSIKYALQERMLIKKFILGAVFYVEFNHQPERISANKNFRKAIQHAFDPEELVYKVIGLPGNKVAYSIFPTWLDGETDKFSKEYPPRKPEIDLALARTYLEKARQESGLEKIPPVILLTGDSPIANKEAEYFQALLKETLGLEIKIDKQIFKQRLAKMAAGEFDMVLAAWGPDYHDASTFGDLFYSKNHNNHGRYNNPQYDFWVNYALNNTDVSKRMKAFSEMQNIIYEEVVLLPTFERGIVYVQNPQLKGLKRRIFGGDPSFRYAYIEEKQNKQEE